MKVGAGSFRSPGGGDRNNVWVELEEVVFLF
ncbi:hypothetical protein CBNA_0078 [Coxiella burnetii str. Namibia]|nr:hypothetical protein CBNA_0078 [Coxiella burnetii str. Namibia]